MLIKGVDQTSIRNRQTVVLERSKESGLDPITLTVYALPPSYADEAEAEMPSPKPPKLRVSRNKQGRIDTDRHGRPVQLYDEHDPGYLKDSQSVSQLHATKMIVDALDRDEIQFEAKNNGDPAAYYAAARKEMIDFGFSIGDMVTLLEAVSKVSNLIDEEVERAKQDFLSLEE